jgi:hypothetical protein
MLSMRSVVLGCCAQAQKHCTENVRQSFHLVNPPELVWNPSYGKLQKTAKELVVAPLANDAKPMPN